MKKILLMVVASIMATASVKAQNEDLKHEIGVSYGLGVSCIGDGIGNAIGRGVWEIGVEGNKWTNDKQFGSLGIEYFYHLENPKVAVGAIATYAQYGEDVVNKSGAKLGDRVRRYISLMPSMKYYWVNKNTYGFYSKVAAGAMLLTEKSKKESAGDHSDSSWYFMCQVSALGFEFGGKFRGFIEVGAGEQGIVLGGLKYKF